VVAVVEMSQSSWLVGGVLSGSERQPRKKLEPSPNALSMQRVFPSCAREETREEPRMPCLFLNTERVLGGKPPKNRGFVAI